MKLFLTIKSRIEKSSFESIFTDKSAAEKNTSQDEKNDKKNKKKSRCQKYTEEAATICHRCELSEHYHLHCFYLLPQKTSKRFILQKDLKKAAEKTLKKNVSLTKKIKQI